MSADREAAERCVYEYEELSDHSVGPIKAAIAVDLVERALAAARFAGVRDGLGAAAKDMDLLALHPTNSEKASDLLRTVADRIRRIDAAAVAARGRG